MAGDQRSYSDHGADRAPYPFRQPLPRLVLPRVAERPGPDRLDEIGPGALRLLQAEPIPGGWLVAVKGTGYVELLDEDLKLRRQLAIPTPVVGDAYRHVSVDSTCSIVAVSYYTALRVFSAPHGERLRLLWEAGYDQLPWYGFFESWCSIDHQSRLWWVRPGASKTDHVVVSDARTGVIIADAPIEQRECSYRVALHPDGDAAIIDGAAGQDGSFLWQTLMSADGLALRELGEGDCIMGSFSAGGSRFVTAPHHDGTMSIHRWPDATITGSINTASIFLDEAEVGEAAHDWLYFHAEFLGDRHVVAETWQHRLVLCAVDPLRPIAELWPDGYEIRGYDRAGQRVDRPADALDYEGDLIEWAIAGNQLLTAHASGALHLWDLSPVQRV